jgi:hypothetical protein
LRQFDIGPEGASHGPPALPWWTRRGGEGVMG